MTVGEFWPIVAFAAAAVFAAGQLVEKSRNNSYVKKDLCTAFRNAEADRWLSVCDRLSEIKASVAVIQEYMLSGKSGTKE